jgi:hypothetical protein
MKTRSSKKATIRTLAGGSLALLPAILIIFVAACATSTPPPAPETDTAVAVKEGVPGMVVVNTVKVSARVTAIDKKKRTATLLGPDGKKYPIKVGPEAVNFDQVKMNDLVNVTLTEELVVYLEKEGTASSDGEAGVVALAPKGEKPAGLVAQTIRTTGTVESIDQKKRTATVRFEDGTTKTFPVRDDIDLSKHKAGERLVFHLTEMIAISVEKE